MARPAGATRSPRATRKSYRIFISHSGDDIWVARQIARRLDEIGASTFLDRRDIAAGDNFRQRIRDEIPGCQELLALFTPWSRQRAWVRHEIGMADALGKRIVCVFYKVSKQDFEQDDDGMAALQELNTIDINALDDYFEAVASRVR